MIYDPAQLLLLGALPDRYGGESRYVHVIGSSVFVDDRLEDREWPVHFVGLVDGQAWWGVDVPHGQDPSYGAAIDLRAYHGVAQEHQWLAAGRAVQIVEWARTNRFCGRCSTPTEPSPGERALRCPACSLVAFPRLSPAMITLVTRGEAGSSQEALLARGVNFPRPMYSCLAGFVEPGESLEAAVVREVREEVGLTVGNPTYFSSQPWPFPNSVMVGFFAEYVSGDITPDMTEIADARWFGRGEVPQIPSSISIARRLIDHWLLA